MSTSPRSPTPSPDPVRPEPEGFEPLESIQNAGESEIDVPRGIVRWSKWRQGALRAEHRQARQQMRAAAAAKSAATTPKSGPT